VHVAPTCAGSGEWSDHFGSYVRNFSLHFCKRLFPGLELMTSWSQGNSFTAVSGLPFLPLYSLIKKMRQTRNAQFTLQKVECQTKKYFLVRPVMVFQVNSSHEIFTINSLWNSPNQFFSFCSKTFILKGTRNLKWLGETLKEAIAHKKWNVLTVTTNKKQCNHKSNVSMQCNK
jgi:hypothetical protein